MMDCNNNLSPSRKRLLSLTMLSVVKVERGNRAVDSDENGRGEAAAVSGAVKARCDASTEYFLEA